MAQETNSERGSARSSPKHLLSATDKEVLELRKKVVDLTRSVSQSINYTKLSFSYLKEGGLGRGGILWNDLNGLLTLLSFPFLLLSELERSKRHHRFAVEKIIAEKTEAEQYVATIRRECEGLQRQMITMSARHDQQTQALRMLQRKHSVMVRQRLGVDVQCSSHSYSITPSDCHYYHRRPLYQ